MITWQRESSLARKISLRIVETQIIITRRYTMRKELLDLLQGIVDGHNYAMETLESEDAFDEAVDKMYSYIISHTEEA